MCLTLYIGTSAGGRTSLQRNARTYFYLTWSLFFLISSFLVNARFQFWSCFKEHLLRKIIILFSFSWKDRKDINWRSSSSQSLTSNQITRGQGEWSLLLGGARLKLVRTGSLHFEESWKWFHWLDWQIRFILICQMPRFDELQRNPRIFIDFKPSLKEVMWGLVSHLASREKDRRLNLGKVSSFCHFML